MTNTPVFKVSGLTKIHEFWGEDPGCFLVQLHCEVTKVGDLGGEAFSVTVTSPRQLDRELQSGEGIEYGRGYILMLDYDERTIASCLQKLLDGCREADWEALESFVTRYFDWIE